MNKQYTICFASFFHVVPIALYFKVFRPLRASFCRRDTRGCRLAPSIPSRVTRNRRDAPCRVVRSCVTRFREMCSKGYRTDIVV